MEEFDNTWLERTYSGAPNECGQCYREGKIVKAEDCTEHDGQHDCQ